MSAQTPSTLPPGVALNDPKLFRQACYVGGAWVPARSGATVPVDDPASGAIIGTVPRMGAVETRGAIDAAAAAFPTWRRNGIEEYLETKYLCPGGI